MIGGQSALDRFLSDMQHPSDDDLRRAREIAIALAEAPTKDDFMQPQWLGGWVQACRAGEYDSDDEVRGPLLGMMVGRENGDVRF